jgi:hypothetical protein
MHALTLNTRFTFGDRVHFKSVIQDCAGTGTVFGITIDKDGLITYLIDTSPDDDVIHAGIVENEMVLVGSDG